MKRSFVWLLTALLSLILFQAGESALYQGGEVVRVAEGDTIHGNFFAAARLVEIEGVVTGNAYLFCETARVSGTVKNTVHAFCRRLEVTGKVENQVLFFGESLFMDGSVNGDVLAMGRLVELTGQSQLGGSLRIGAAELLMNGGMVKGTLEGGLGHAYLDGQVMGPVHLEAEEVNFGEHFQAPEVYLELPRALEKTKAGPLPENLHIEVKKPRRFYQRLYFYWSLGAMMVVGLLMVGLGKHRLQDLLSVASRRPLASLGTGFLTLVVTPVAAALLLVLILTIPVGLILLVLYLILLYLAYVLSSIFLGHVILQKLRGNGSPAGLALSVLLGVVLLSLLAQVPVLGTLVKLIALCLGLGMLVVYFQESNKSAATA